MTAFTPGVELAWRYWHEVVRPIVVTLLPGPPNAAGLASLGCAGGIDQFIDSTDILSYPSTARRVYDLTAGGV